MNLSWKVVIVFSGIFIAGAVTGGALGHFWTKKTGFGHPQLRNPVEQFRTQIANTARRLELTDQQREQIKPAIAQAADELHRLRRTGFQEAHEIIERLNANISKVLTPEQASKFEEIKKHQLERMRNFQQGLRVQKRPDGALNPESQNPPPPADAKDK